MSSEQLINSLAHDIVSSKRLIYMSERLSMSSERLILLYEGHINSSEICCPNDLLCRPKTIYLFVGTSERLINLLCCREY